MGNNLFAQYSLKNIGLSFCVLILGLIFLLYQSSIFYTLIFATESLQTENLTFLNHEKRVLV